jgi:RNA polymerase sigma-70 factor (ECF subfamily)
MSDFKKVDDIQLLKDAVNGNPDAYGELYERYSTLIFRFLYAHSGNRLDAEDLTEDVFLRVWRSLPAYRERGIPFKAYLFRVARHALIDHYRKAGHQQRTVSTEDVLLYDQEPGPAEVVSSNLEQARIGEALTRMQNDDYRVVLIMRFLLDFSPDEAAQAMGRSIGALRVLQHRALQALRSLMDGNEYL